MSVVDYLYMLFFWLPNWFISAFLGFVVVFAAVLVVKFVAFFFDATPF